MRELTNHERLLTRWMIEHGDASEEEQARLLEQLGRAAIFRSCACGCESVDFAIDGQKPHTGRFRIVGDFVFGGGAKACGVFVFCSGRTLAGIEVYSLGGADCRELPSPHELRPFPG